MLLPVLSLALWSGAACTDRPGQDAPTDGTTVGDWRHIRLLVGGAEFAATLADNAAAREFAARLPMTLAMNELNGNEKYGQLSEPLPTASEAPGRIHTGDLMLWGDDTLVLFYDTFSTSYRYTRLGAIDRPDGLADALGRGGVTVTFEPAPRQE